MATGAGGDFEACRNSTFHQRANLINGGSVCDDSRILGEPASFVSAASLAIQTG